MKRRRWPIALMIYDLFLSAGAVVYGFRMIFGTDEIFRTYPKEWLGKVPFDSWVAPGIIAVVIYGLGNALAAILCIGGKRKTPWLASLIMGAFFFASLVAQVLIFGECYMATAWFFLFSIIQLCLSLHSAYRSRKEMAKAA